MASFWNSVTELCTDDKTTVYSTVLSLDFQLCSLGVGLSVEMHYDSVNTYNSKA